MKALRVLPLAMAGTLLFYTGVVIQRHGWEIFPVGCGALARLAWPGQSSLDFTFMVAEPRGAWHPPERTENAPAVASHAVVVRGGAETPVRRSVEVLVAAGVLGATVLTMFCFVHEERPRALRAPTSLLLAPVAIVDGLCYALGVPGIHGQWIPVFLINLASASLTCLAVRGLWRRRRPPLVR